MKIFSRSAYFAGVCVLTWMLTSSMFAQQPRKQKPQSSISTRTFVNPPTSVSKVTTVERDPGVTIPPVKLGTSQWFAEAHMRSGEIILANGLAKVRAHVSMADRRKGMMYLWRLRVVDPQEIPLAGRVYDDQIFAMDSNGQKEIDFEEKVEVPLGARRIELVLYEKPPGKDLSFLENDDTARANQMIRLVRLLTN